jgi:peroxiredoxin Q/BCP
VENFSWLLLAALAASPLPAPTPAQKPPLASPLAGKPAPDFTLPSDRGGNVKLSSFKGKQNVLLAFFPKAFTAG